MSQNRQLAAIMFTDIVGYTRLMGDNEDKAFEMLSRNRRLQKPLIEKFNGHWVKELGDGVLARFTTVSDAVMAAVEIQHAADKEEFSLRIGIHQGEIVIENDDVFGDAVNIAARIQSIAPVGTILVSESVHLNVVNKQDIQTIFFREEQLKNVTQSMRLYMVVTNLSSNEPVLTSTTYNPALLKSIAVLPFVNMSNDPEQEFFSDGISEEILNSLSHVKQLKVAGRTSAFQFKGQNIDLREVGKKLNVTNVLEGSVRKHGKRLRITAQLINVEDGYHIWSERYDRDIDDIFTIQDEIALAITEKLKITLLDEEIVQVKKKCCTNDPQAYEEYLRGRFYLARRGQWVLKAIGHFEKAISIDPRFALAYAGLADATLVSSFYSIRPGIDVMKKGKEAADKCIELDPTLPEAYTSLGYYYVALVRDGEKGRKYFMKSLELDPNYTLGRYMLGLLYYAWTKGDIKKALEHTELTRRQEPLSAIVHSVHSLVLASAGSRDEEVAEIAKTAIELDMNAFLAHRSLVIATRNLKRYNEALENANRFVSVSNRHSHSIFDLLEVHVAMDNNKEAENLYRELVTRSKEEYINSSYMALAAADIGEIEEAFLYFQKAAQERDVMLLTLPHIKYHATTILTKDHRFRELVNIHEPEKALAEMS